MKKLRIKLRGKNIELDLKEMRGINKFLGLMVYRKSNLIFQFKEGKKEIHSLFCPGFIAIWLNGGKIVDINLVKPWKFSIKPEEDYNQLIEIPVNNSNSEIVNYLMRFIDERRKI